MRRPEQALQIAVARFLSVALKPPTIWTSLDAGAGKMSKASAGLRKARGVKAGWPDILVMHPHPGGSGTCVLGIELKADYRSKPSAAQLEVSDKLFDVNAAFVICRSLEEVAECIDRSSIIPLHARLS